MRVNIEHYETKTGIFKKVTHYGVAVTVTFSEEEKSVIKSRKIEKTIVLERRMGSMSGLDEKWDLTIGMLVSGACKTTFFTLAEAKQYDANIRDALVDLKKLYRCKQ